MGSALLLTLMTFIVIYVAVFKDDFKTEDIDKVTPFLAVATILVFIIFILSNLGS